MFRPRFFSVALYLKYHLTYWGIVIVPASRNVWVYQWAETASGAQPVLPFHENIVLPIGRRRFFNSAECERIIRLGEAIKPHAAITGDGAAITAYEHRRSTVRQLVPGDETYGWIFERLEALVAQARDHFRFELTGFYEGAQYYEYPTGGYLDAHMDIGRGHMSTRKLGITVQLSVGASYEGGDLEFLSSRGTGPRELGSVIMFPAYMMHRVTPVTRGARKCLVSWVHGPPFR
jgi:PKHD-type hydroxylase